MNGRTDTERALDAFLAEGPDAVADEAVIRALDAVDRTTQRRGLLAPWRVLQMQTYARLLAAAVVAIFALGGMYLLGQRSSVGGNAATPTQSPGLTSAPSSPASSRSSSTAAPSQVDTTGWTTFRSAYYGFSASHPNDWSVQPASEPWTIANDNDANWDIFWSRSGWPDFQGFETRIPAGSTAQSFVQTFTADAVKTACYPTVPTDTKIDGHKATIALGGCNEHFYYAEAIAVIGDRIWIFDLRGPDRSLIVPFLSTVKLDPGSVVD